MQTAMETAFETSIQLASAGEITSEALQEQIQTTMQTAMETAFEMSIQLAEGGKITTEALQEQIQTTMQTAMETAMETSIQLASAGEITAEELQEQIQTAMQTAMETTFETSIQLAEGGKITTEQLQEQIQTAMQTATETAMETSIQLASAGEITSEELQEQIQTAMQTAMETAMETSIQLASAGEITTEALQEQIQTTMQTAMETAMETSIQLASAGKITTEELQEQIQTAMQTAMATAFETSIQLASAGEITSEALQEQIQTAMQTAMQTAFETSIQLASAGKITTEQLQEQIQTSMQSAMATAFETMIQTANTREITTEQLQEQIQTAMQTAIETAMYLTIPGNNNLTVEQIQNKLQNAMQTAMEVAFETMIQTTDTGKIRTEQFQEQIQTAMQTAMEVAFENSIRLATGGEITSELIQTEMIKTRIRIEEQLKARVANRVKTNKFLLKHALVSSTVIARSIEGKPKYDENGKIDLFVSSASFTRFNPQAAAAMGYTPRKSLLSKQRHVDRLGRGLANRYGKFVESFDRYLAKTRKFMSKNARLPGGRAMDTLINSKVGGLVFNLVDMVDIISDVLSVVCTFTDGFFYDPAGTGLSWEPWDPSTFEHAAQRMINAQLNTIDEYNRSILPSDYDYPNSLAQYPLIVGPLEKTPIPDRYQGDTEYIQSVITSEISAVLEKILRDTTIPEYQRFRDRLRTVAFNGDQSEMDAYYTDPEYPDEKLIYKLVVLEQASCRDYDDLYRIAFTDVCTTATVENGVVTRPAGVVYEDEYEGVTCSNDPNYKRKRFQCGYRTMEECKINAFEYMESNGQIGTYGEWWDDMSTLKDTRTNPTGTVIVPRDRFIHNSPVGACIVTGQGIRSMCKQATLTDTHYSFEQHKCVFDESLCQSFGTCVATNSSGQTYCKIPKILQGSQNFFGSQMPREWVRVNGCHSIDLGDDEVAGAFNFFANNGKHFFNDMLKNQANWNKGMKEMFIGSNALDTWMNLATSIGPMILGYLGMTSGPLMILIFIVVGSQMADAAVKANRSAAQIQPNDAAEYTIGGWKTNQVYSNIYALEIMTKTSASTTYVHYLQPGNKVRFLNLKWTNGTTTQTISAVDVTILTVPDSTSFTFNTIQLDPSKTIETSLPGFTSFVDKKGYVKLISPANITYTPNPQTGRSKMPQPVGYMDGWLTKPLRPKNANGQIVPVTAGVDEIAGVVQKNFYIDVQANNRAYREGDNCPPTLATIASLASRIFNLKNRFNSWNFSQVTADINRDLAIISASYETARAQTQARLDDLRSQRRDLENACQGIGLIDGTCIEIVARYVGGNIQGAFSELDDMIVQTGLALEAIGEAMAAGIRTLFTEFANQIKGYFEEYYDIMKTTANQDWSGRCVNRRIEQNKDLAEAMGDFVCGKLLRQVTRQVLEAMNCPSDIIDTIMDIEYWGRVVGSAGLCASKCITTGKINIDVDAFSPECYMATAVDSATGTITAPGSSMINMHINWDDWMDRYEYKRLCYEGTTPMIRAWSASLANSMWCIPPQPPESWADPNIGILDPLATQYAVNRSWTNFGDGPEYFSFDYPQYPDGVLYQQTAETKLRDSAKHWWYQLVYSKEDFNKDNLWNDAVLQEHFTHETIAQMRAEYCMDDLLGTEDIDPIPPAQINDKCWGYLSIAIPGYKYTPMAILSKITQAA